MWSWLSGRKKWWQPERRDGALESGAEGRDGARRVSMLREALPQIAAEFERARRYERSVTVAIFTGAAGAGGNGAKGHHAAATDDPGPLAGFLASATREIDLVTCHPAARCCVVMMPEIGPEEGRRAVSRIRELCARRLGRPVAAGIAVFPSDGWLFMDLVEAARRNARTADEEHVAAAAGSTQAAEGMERAHHPLRVEPAQGT